MTLSLVLVPMPVTMESVKPTELRRVCRLCVRMFSHEANVPPPPPPPPPTPPPLPPPTPPPKPKPPLTLFLESRRKCSYEFSRHTVDDLRNREKSTQYSNSRIISIKKFNFSTCVPEIFLRYRTVLVCQENNLKTKLLKIIAKMLNYYWKCLGEFCNFIFEPFPASLSLVWGWVCPGRLPAARRPTRIHRLG